MLYFVKAVTKIVVLPLILAVFITSANIALATDNNVGGDGAVVAWRLNVRAAPSNESAISFVLKEGARIKIYGETGEVGSWIQIAFEGQKGYVRNRSKYIRLIKTIKPKTDFEKNSAKEIITVKPVEKSVGETDFGVADKKILEKKIKQKQEKIISFSKEEKIIIEGLYEIDSTLNKARVKVSHLSANLDKLDSKITYIVEEKEKIIEEYDQKRIYSGTRLNALYRMRMLGKFEIIAEPDSIFDFILKQRYS